MRLTNGLTPIGSCAKSANKCLTCSSFYAIIFEVMRDEMNNEINKMNNENMIDRIDQHLGGLLTELRTELRTEQTVLVSCCGCNEELHITRDEADQWTDTDWFMCQECE